MYTLIEMQTENGTTNIVQPIQKFTEKNEAESAYHTALAAAAISKVPVHAVVLLDEHGTVQRRECYEHAEV